MNFISRLLKHFFQCSLALSEAFLNMRKMFIAPRCAFCTQRRISGAGCTILRTLAINGFWKRRLFVFTYILLAVNNTKELLRYWIRSNRAVYPFHYRLFSKSILKMKHVGLLYKPSRPHIEITEFQMFHFQQLLVSVTCYTWMIKFLPSIKTTLIVYCSGTKGYLSLHLSKGNRIFSFFCWGHKMGCT